MRGSEKKLHRRLPLLFACILLLQLLAPAANAAQPETVRVGYMLTENFQEEEVVQQNGQEMVLRSGYGYEYLQMIRNYTGWKYEYVTGTWEELLEMLSQGRIDILGYVGRTQEREETMLFSTEPQGRQNHYLYVDGPSEAIDPNDYTTLNGKTIGVLRGDFRTGLFLDWCQEKGITCQIQEFSDMEAVHTAFHSGQIHGVSTSSLGIAAYPEGQWRPVIRFDDAPVYFAVRKDTRGRQLLAQVNQAQSQLLEVNENFSQELQQKYMPRAAGSTELTKQETQLLKKQGVLKVGYYHNCRPLAYTNGEGELAGLLAEYLSAMEKAYGIQFQVTGYPDGSSLLGALQQGDVDIIAPVSCGYNIAENYHMAVSLPMTEETMVAVYKGYPGTEPKNIFERLAIVDTSTAEKDYAARFYSGSQWVLAQSDSEAIDMVVDGRATCYMTPSSVWSSLYNTYEQINELQALALPDSNEINMVIANENIPLLPILNKGICLLTQADVNQAIVAHTESPKEVTWLTLVQQDPLLTGAVTLAVVLFIGFVLVLYRLETDKRYMKRLQAANRKAEQARREAERANLAKSTFLTSMSHDIRTPMNAVIGMTTLASKHINDPEYVRGCLNKVTLASEHLLTLINDVLDINKIESGNLSLTPNVFSLADTIMNLANIGRHQLQEKNHRFDIRVHNIQQEYLFADELRINQVFINLLSNAIKYTPDGGRITIDVKEEPVPGQRDQVRLVFIIEDTGIGMTKEFQNHMYDLFAMANRNVAAVNGSGVGLAICKQLVNLMQGTIECDSWEGQGTKFTVTLDLPVADKVVDSLVLPPMEILLVDDDRVFLATASETLKELGLSADCVESGEKAVEQVKARHTVGKDYPLIIIDWQMPDMDGIETTRRIRSQVGPDVSIIVISAYAPEDIRSQAMAAGANGFINKPFFRSHAYQSISGVLGLGTNQEAAASDLHRKVRGLRVLIAEDNDLNWEIVRELLQMYGVEADRAENGQRCLATLEQSRPRHYDGVLMDIQMPLMNGYEAAKAIRRMEREDLRSIPVIAMTADAYTEDVLRCAEAGMNGHIPKPIDMERLLEVLADLGHFPAAEEEKTTAGRAVHTM